MKYILVYANRAVKDISRLDASAKLRIKESLEKFAESPMDYARKMVDSALGTYRFRVGDYRIIFDIHGNEEGPISQYPNSPGVRGTECRLVRICYNIRVKT